MNRFIFISHSADEQEKADQLCSLLENNGFTCWIAPRDLMPGSNWGDTIDESISSSRRFVLLLSSKANKSYQIQHEVQVALHHRIHIDVIRVEDVLLSPFLKTMIRVSDFYDAFGIRSCKRFDNYLKQLQLALPEVVQQEQIIETNYKNKKKNSSKGYIFISYVKADSRFVKRLAGLLQEKKYAYWEYTWGERDYNHSFYIELEERINNAAAFLCVVSDRWRESDWGASEYIYAKDAGKDIFVVVAARLKKPMPLLLNLHNRIDMSNDFEGGATVLHNELRKKGL